ncbi:Patched domain-containing protein 3 [Armadillidium nasatum]|uniref:Patched domain-containing protein 3 n=1 Tax=Armadillidium nasatum TaxID=96803 RepID=A0A5N5TP67_9CRUS|nr:Patched domain-containing protein 3 [Armadillidium nasatum]
MRIILLYFLFPRYDNENLVSEVTTRKTKLNTEGQVVNMGATNDIKYVDSTDHSIRLHIAKNPSYYIIIPVFLSLLGMTGIQRLDYEKDPEYLFSPTNGLGRKERIEIEKVFPVDYANNFDPSRITRISHFARLLITAKDNETMLRVHVWKDLIALDQAVRNISVEYDERNYTFAEICAKRSGKCIDNPVFNLNEFMPEIENRSMWLNYPVMLYPLVLPFFFGGAVVNETEGVLISTEAIALNYWLRDDDKRHKKASHLWEGKLLEYLDSVKFENINVARYVSRSLEDELDRNAEAITPYLALTVILMVSFSVFSVFTFDWVRSKFSIGILGVLSATMATGCGFGILMYCGVPFIGINMAAPFLMLGIGIDDMFVVLSAWQRTKIQDDVPTRMAEAYSEAAVSVTITSLTNMLSFFIGTWTPFPSVQIFCLYTGIAILITYLWFLTFFGGVLALSGYKEQNQKHIITGKVVKSKSEAEDMRCCYKFWCAGGINKNDPWNPIDNKDHTLMVFFRDYLGKALNKPIVKALVILTFLIYLSGAIYGCLKVKEGLERRNLALDKSYMINFFDTEDKLFRKYPYRIQIIINDNLTYSDPDTKIALLKLHNEFENLPYIGSRLFTQSWIRGFYRFLRRRPEHRANITDEASFIEVLRKEYLTPSSQETLDVVFNEDKTRILASRFILQSYMINDTNQDKDMMQALRKVAEGAPYHVIAYHAFFVFFDQFLLVRTTSIQTICLAALVMMVVSLIFIPNPLCSLWVAFSIISIEVGVIGYMSLWGVNLDSVSMINLIMCIGFSVDFSAHISYAYLTARVKTSKDRVRECLYNLGLPVIQGGLSTIIGVLVLVIAPSYIFQTFFRIVFLVIFFGIVHGTLLLPVMLSLLGPGSCTKHEDEENSVECSYDVNEIIPEITSDPNVDKSPLRLVRIIKDDNDSLDRDLGIGSSGSSSQSSLHEN